MRLGIAAAVPITWKLVVASAASSNPSSGFRTTQWFLHFLEFGQGERVATGPCRPHDNTRPLKLWLHISRVEAEVVHVLRRRGAHDSSVPPKPVAPGWGFRGGANARESNLVATNAFSYLVSRTGPRLVRGQASTSELAKERGLG